jgi:hypothetical protein
MLDQDARTDVAPPPEPTLADRPARGRRGALWAVLAVLVAVVLAAAGFAVGRASDNGGSSAVTTRPISGNQTSPKSSAGKTSDTVPTLAFGEAVEKQPDKPLDNATRDALAADLVEARTAALRYPTVADARAAHMLQAGNFAPGAGAHFINYSGVKTNPDGSVNAGNPASYIYDGINPTSRIVGVMYTSLSDGPAPKGFPGPNDHWHLHQNLCIKYGPSGITVPFAPDRDVTKAQCDLVHGDFMRRTVWMVHAWVVPGWESPAGVFAHSNPDLTCKDGTMHTDKVGFCKGT